MFYKSLLPAVGLVCSLFAATVVQAAEVKVISDRTPSHLNALFKHYEAQTGVKINAVFVKKGLIARLESRPTEADIVITKAANLLETAKQKKLLRAFSTDQMPKLDPVFVDPDNTYVTLSYRPRSIFASRDRVPKGTANTYDDLLDAKWKGRVCIRSGYHPYNMSLFSQMAVDKGLDYARNYIKGLHANLARVPKGNDRAQIRGIYEDQCDLSLGNSYYMPLMLSRDDQRPWGEATYLTFPDQAGEGAYVLRGGAGLTTATGNAAEANRFLAYLAGEDAQSFIVNTTYEYPVNGKVAISAKVTSLGDHQPEVKGGHFKAKFIPLSKIAEMRPEIVKILDEINFDSK